MTIDPALMQQLAGNPAAGREMLRSLLAERAASDPRMAMIAQLLESRSGASGGSGAAGDTEDEPTRSDRAQRIRARIRSMQRS